MNILLIEDNIEIAENIKKLLNVYEPNFHIDIAYDFKQWYDKFKKNNYNLIILDLMLPGGNWLDLLKKIRKISTIPVIIVTALWDDDHKIKWLTLWADDYITKPFKVKELFLRIKNIIKRYNIDEKIKINNKFIINFTKRSITTNNWEEIKLSNKEFLILELLYNRAAVEEGIISGGGVALVRAQKSLEDLNPENQNKLDVYISNIRKKIDKNLIETIKWYGYKINTNLISKI